MMLGRGLQNRNHSNLLVMTRLILTLVLSLVLKNSAIAQNEYDAIFEELQDKYDVEKGDEWNLDKQVSVIEKYSRKNPNIFVADDFRGRVIEVLDNSVAKEGMIKIYGIDYFGHLCDKSQRGIHNAMNPIDKSWRVEFARADSGIYKDSVGLDYGREDVEYETIRYHLNTFGAVLRLDDKGKSVNRKGVPYDYGDAARMWMNRSSYTLTLRNGTSVSIYFLGWDRNIDGVHWYDKIVYHIDVKNNDLYDRLEVHYEYPNLESYPSRYDSLIASNSYAVYAYRYNSRVNSDCYLDKKNLDSYISKIDVLLSGDTKKQAMAYWMVHKAHNNYPENSPANLRLEKIYSIVQENRRKYENDQVRDPIMAKKDSVDLEKISYLSKWSEYDTYIQTHYPSKYRDYALSILVNRDEIDNEYANVVKSKSIDYYNAFGMKYKWHPYKSEIGCFLCVDALTRAEKDSTFEAVSEARLVCERNDSPWIKNCSIKEAKDKLDIVKKNLTEYFQGQLWLAYKNREDSNAIGYASELIVNGSDDWSRLWRARAFYNISDYRASLSDYLVFKKYLLDNSKYGNGGSNVFYMNNQQFMPNNTPLHSRYVYTANGRSRSVEMQVDSSIASLYRRFGIMDSAAIYTGYYNDAITNEKRIINEESRSVEEAKNAAKAGANLPLEQSDVVGVWISCRRETGEAIIINGKYTYQLFNKKGVFLIAMGRTVDEAFGNMTSDIRSGRIMTGTYSISGSKVTMIDSEGTLVHDYSNQYGGFLTFKNTSGALRFHEVPSWMR
jgi:hypothetical protein